MKPRFSIDRALVAGYERRRRVASDVSVALSRRRSDLMDTNQHLLVIEHDRKSGLNRPQDALLASTKERLDDFRAELEQISISIDEVNSGPTVIIGERIAELVRLQDGARRYVGGDAQ